MGVGGTLPSGADEIFQGDAAHTQATDRVISPEQAMWIAVVGRAWLDAFEASDHFLVQSERKAADPEIVRAGARRWLVLDHSGWKEDRETVCIMAGVDPDTIRNAARRRLKATRIEAANDLDTAFLALAPRLSFWEGQPPIGPSSHGIRSMMPCNRLASCLAGGFESRSSRWKASNGESWIIH